MLTSHPKRCHTLLKEVDHTFIMSNFFTSEHNLEAYDEEEETNDRFLLHMDIDYFFAQVEILQNSDLKGTPLIVGNPNARETKRGVVLTCSYETRKFGVRSGMSMAEALKRCPDATIVGAQHPLYSEYSTRVMDILRSYGLPMRKAGSDEAYLDITDAIDPTGDHLVQAEKFATQLKTKIRTQENLTVSVGIGPTLKIAKIASDYKKPDGVTIVLKDQLGDFLKDLALIKIPGIGPKTAERLGERGYTTCSELMDKTESELIELLGSWGEYIHKVFKGETTNRILPRGERKSISNERTFIGKPRDIEFYMEIINTLFERTYTGLVKYEFFTRTVNLKIRFNGYETLSRAKTLNAITQSKDVLYETVLEVVKPYLDDPRGLRLLGVGFSNLEKVDDTQMQLDDWFDDPSIRPKIPIIEPKKDKKEKHKEEPKSLDDWL